jgi:hypothetical protein
MKTGRERFLGRTVRGDWIREAYRSARIVPRRMAGDQTDEIRSLPTR